MLTVQIKKKIGSFKLDVDFVCDNEILGLLGASGCGKSMTLRCVAGIQTPDSGRIVLNDRVLFDSEKKINLPPQQRRVGYLFQQYALFPNMTVAGNIEAGLHAFPKEERKQITADMIRRFHLEGLEDHHPSQLSGGQQQRTALARIFGGNPDILLMDEPFSALDGFLKWQLEPELLDTLESFGKDVLFVSHDRDEVCHFCHRVCMISNGRTIGKRPVMELMRDPRNYSAALLSGCRNISAAVIKNEHTLECTDWGVTFTLTDPIPADTAFVGMRAAHIVNDPTAVNRIDCTVERIIEDQSGKIAILTTPAGRLIQMPDDGQSGVGAKVSVAIDEKALLLLTA